MMGGAILIQTVRQLVGWVVKQTDTLPHKYCIVHVYYMKMCNKCLNVVACIFLILC